MILSATPATLYCKDICTHVCESPTQVCLVADLCDLECVHDVALCRERVEVEPCERVRRENGERDAGAGEHEVHAGSHVLDEVRQLHVVVLHTAGDVHQVHQVHLRRATYGKQRKDFSDGCRISHREGGVPNPGGDAPTYYLAIFDENWLKKEENGPRGGHASLLSPSDLLMVTQLVLEGQKAEGHAFTS